MERISFFIDGFNVYHSLKPYDQATHAFITKYIKYLWLDFNALAKRFLRGTDQLSDVFYFTALAYWKAQAVRRHQIYIDALEHQGVTLVKGKFKNKNRYCRYCHRQLREHEEKQTDVNIAIYLLSEAFKDTYDKAIILSNDTDLIPAIKAVKTTFPHKRIGILFPIDRFSNELRRASDFYLRTNKKDLRNSQLPENITRPNGYVLSRPPSWR